MTNTEIKFCCLTLIGYHGNQYYYSINNDPFIMFFIILNIPHSPLNLGNTDDFLKSICKINYKFGVISMFAWFTFTQK